MKRALSLILALVMLLGMVPVQVLAAEAGHVFKNGICQTCGKSASELGYTHGEPENQGVANAIARAYQLTDVEWTPLADVPGVQKIDGNFTVIRFEAGVTYRGIPYSGVTATDTYVGLNVSLGSFLTALQNQNSVLYTENLHSTNEKSATYFGTVCSKFAQYILDIPGSYNTNNVANIPGVDTIAMPGKYTVDDIRLGDIVLHTQNHTTVCTDILYDSNGEVAFIEISEAVLPLVRRMLWSPEEFYEHFSGYRLCRYQHLADVPAAPAWPDVHEAYALMPRMGDKYNYKVSTTKALVDILESGYSTAVVLRDGHVVDRISIGQNTKTFAFDCSVPGHIEMYLEKADGTRSGSVHANVVRSSVSVEDSGEFARGRLTVTIDGSSGTPLYVQVGSAHAIFCNVEGREGTVELTFPASKISTRQVRVAYQNEYGIYLSKWVSFTADENPSKDPLLSRGQYWNGYNITPSSPTPVIQEGKAGYWSYTMIPVEENTTYYSLGATRLWYLDANGAGISTFNAYKDGEVPCQFTTPDGAAYVNIAYSPNLVDQGEEKISVVEEDGKDGEETLPANPSTDPYLSRGEYWDGFALTPSSSVPVIQADKPDYWTYAMVPVEGNTTYYSVGANRIWFFDANGKPLSTCNAIKDGDIPFQFTTPAKACYASITYAASVVEKGTETMEKVIPGPVITQQPESVQQENGKEFAITMKAEGEGLIYQWYIRRPGSDEWEHMAVAGNVYTAVMTGELDGCQIYCIVSDANGQTAASDTAKLTCLVHEHDYSIVVTAPTCTEAGTERRECSVCGHYEIRTVAASGHDYQSVVTDPTHTEKGYTTHTCACGDQYSDNYTDELGHFNATAETLADGEKLVLTELNVVKHNKSLIFSATVADLGDGLIRISHGENTYAGNHLEITADKILVYTTNSGTSVKEYSHGLDISGDLYVRLDAPRSKVNITIITDSGTYRKTVAWSGCNGDISCSAQGTALQNVDLRWFAAGIESDFWFFGDSWFNTTSSARWTSYLMDDGYMDVLLAAYPGMRAPAGLTQFRELLTLDTPKYAIWALGMNNGDRKGAVNESWLTSTEEFLRLCEQYGVTPILCTIPTTPKVDNRLKNAWIRESGYRYIDFDLAVVEDHITGSWFDGMAASDLNHPTELGAKALYPQVFADFPELAKADPAACSHSMHLLEKRSGECEYGGREAYYVCSLCGGQYLDAAGSVRTSTDQMLTAPLGHTWSDWIVVQEPTHIQPGIQERSCTVCGETEGEELPKLEILCGDANGDGRVNGLDLVALRQHLAGWDIIVDASALDVTGDGRCNALDLVRLRQYLAGWDVPLGS